MEPEAASVDDDKLTADADRLGLTGAERKTWFAASNRQRGLMKAREHRRLKAEARTHSINPERYLAMMPDEREKAMADSRARHEARREEILAKADAQEDRVYSSQDEVPATDPKPSRRDGVTVGPITERVDDLFGDRPPRTLADIYARWPLGRPGGEEFYLRIERLQPKRFNGVPVAGFLGEIRHHVVNEAQFGAYFGGEEYHVQLYGPHPKGRRDASNNPIIKALTDPVSVTVPHRPPNLAVVPPTRPKQESTMFDPNSPFGGGLPGAPQPAASAADASIFKTMADLVSDQLKQSRTDASKGDATTPPAHLLNFLGDATTRQVDAAQRDAEARERIMRDQLEAARKESERNQRVVDDLKKEIDSMKSNGSDKAVELMRIRDGDSTRMHENYRIEMETMRNSHGEELRILAQRHDEEVKRMEARIREMEQTHRTALEDERRRREDEEKRLRDEVTRVREEERSESQRRVQDERSRAEDRLKDAEKQHSSELRVEKSNAETRVQTEVTKMEYELTHLKDRLAERERDLEEAKSEAEKNKDPVAVIDDWHKQAKKMGFKKDEGDADKSFWQMIAQHAGAGISQAIGNMDMGTVLGALKGAAPGGAGRPQAPAGQRRPGLPPAQRPPPGPSRRAMHWASQGAPIATSAEAAAQGQPLGGGMVVGPEVPQAPPAPAAGPTGPPPQPHQPGANGPAEPPPQAPPAPAAQGAELPSHRLLETFGDQSTFAFLQSMEGAINAAAPPKQFAEIFFRKYPEPAAKLATQFQAEDSVDFLKAMGAKYPEALGSPILRRDGQKWIVAMWEELRELAGKAAPAPQPAG